MKCVHQLDLALEIGKNSNYINRIENGTYFTSLKTIEEIAIFLKINPIRLFNWETFQSKKVPYLKTVEMQLQEIIVWNIVQIFSDLSLFSSISMAKTVKAYSVRSLLP